VQHLVVPVDGSDESWRGVDVALGLALRCSGHLEIVEVILDPDDTADTQARLTRGLREHDVGDIGVATVAVSMQGDVAGTLCELVRSHAGSTVVMTSRGRGRSTALVGSVTEDLLRKLNDPVVIVGPAAEVTDFTGPIIVTVDGSDTSEAALPIAAAWSIELKSPPWIAEVVQPDFPDDLADEKNEYLQRLAQRLSAISGHLVDHKILSDRHPESAVAALASELDASLIVSSTRGRTGMPRFVLGSTAAGFVRSAPCPVLLIRPPHLDE